MNYNWSLLRLYIDICIWYESVHCNPKVLSTLVWSYEYIIKIRCRFIEVLVCSVVHIVYSMYYTCTGSNFTGEFLCCKEIGIRIWIVKCMYTPVKLDYYKHGESKITVIVKVLWDPVHLKQIPGIKINSDLMNLGIHRRI